MNEAHKKLYKKIVYIFSIFYHFAVGLTIIILLTTKDLNGLEILLPIFILLGCVPHLLIYSVDSKKTSYLIIGLVGLAFGILFLVTWESPYFSVEEICIIWGIIDICRGATEIINVLPHMIKHKNNADIVEILVSTGDIVVGILLCVHTKEGLTLHLIYFAIAFFVTSAKSAIDMFIERHKNEQSFDNH